MTPPLDALKVQGLIEPILPAGCRVTAVEELFGDASTRRYFRARLSEGAAAPSFVVMAYPDEVPAGEELPFLNVHRYLAAARIPVPALYLHDPREKLVVLEDAGDTTLEAFVRAARGFDECLAPYERCVEILARIHSEGTTVLDGRARPLQLAFDVAKFAWEIDFFFEHAVRRFGGIPLSETEERRIEDLFAPFLEKLAALPRVLCHRDYHSRNVMVLPPAAPRAALPLRILDFQDARMGPLHYDVASLLRDSYVTLPDAAADHLCCAYRDAATAYLRRAMGDPGAFGYLVDVAALQRNVKAIGTFGNQAHEKGRTFYLRFIPPTVGHLRRNFERNPAMRPLARKLSPLLEALAARAAQEAPP